MRRFLMLIIAVLMLLPGICAAGVFGDDTQVAAVISGGPAELDADSVPSLELALVGQDGSRTNQLSLAYTAGSKALGQDIDYQRWSATMSQLLTIGPKSSVNLRLGAGAGLYYIDASTPGNDIDVGYCCIAQLNIGQSLYIQTTYTDVLGSSFVDGWQFGVGLRL